MSNYAYSQLIDAYFRTINNRMSKFDSQKCRLYVEQYKSNFDEKKFLQSVGEKLVFFDEEVSDYDSSDIEESEKDTETDDK